jgi:membrane associated rhomboid family serine protease
MESPGPIKTHPPVHPVLWIMVAVMIGFEVLFAAVDAGLFPEGLGRWPVYRQFAFFNLYPVDGAVLRAVPVTLYEATLLPAGPTAALSFLTYAFLHGGWLHLALNSVAFLGLGHAIVQSVGIGRFLAVFAATAATGAATFNLLSEIAGPMVGASGVIFGLLAMITAWQERTLRFAGRSRSMIWRRIAALVAINLAMAWGLDELLAWQAHLGGWVAGWLMALLFPPRIWVFARP